MRSRTKKGSAPSLSQLARLLPLSDQQVAREIVRISTTGKEMLT
jgi:hypothetical protein